MAIPELQERFVHYLKIHYHYSHPEHMASEVFYSSRHNIGMPFDEIFQNEESMRQAKALLTAYFEQIGRKDPKNHANVHYKDWILYKEFLDRHAIEH